MRSLIVMAMFTASLSGADWNEYPETRDLELPADGIILLEIDAAAGSIEGTGAEVIIGDGSGSLQLSDIRGAVHLGGLSCNLLK